MFLLCKNNTGYENLIKIVSESWVTGFYTKPRIDKQLLEKYHEGLIALSACLAGEIPRKLLQDDYDGAKEAALWYDKTSVAAIIISKYRITELPSNSGFCLR